MAAFIIAYQNIRVFLAKYLNKDFLIFMFFLVLSGSFWLMITLNDTYEKEIQVPLRMVGIPKNIVVTTAPSDTVRIVIRDKGFVLLGYSLAKTFVPLSVSFNSFANKQTGHGYIPQTEIQKLMRQQLTGSTAITQIKADQLDFYFNYGRKKILKVQINGNIVAAKNYYLSHVEYSPEVVSVYANKQILDSLHVVQTEFLNIVNFDDTVTVKARLKTVKGMKVEPSVVTIKLYPDILTEESMEVPIITMNKPDNLIIRTFPPKVKVNFTVGASMYRYIKPTDFKVVVDYNEVARNPSDKCNIYLKGKPRDVSNARLELKQVDYLIEQQ